MSRAMSDELNIFEEREPEKKRFQVKSGGVEWTATERLIVWALTVALPERQFYENTVVWLCDVMGRVPRNPHKTRLAGSLTIIEQQTVTRSMSGIVDDTELAQRIFNGVRAGMPLSYVERNKYLPTYIINEHDQDRIPVKDLLILLGRDDRDLETVNRYFDRVNSTGPDTRTDPLPPADRRSLPEETVRRLLSGPSQRLWSQLLSHVWNKPVDVASSSRPILDWDNPDE